jgi:hypothetical protein
MIMNKSFLSLNNLEKISGLFQVIGVLGVMASLIFVGLELRQTQKIALARTQQERSNGIYANFDALTTAGIDWQSAIIDNNMDYVFSKNLIARRNTYHMSWFLFENDYFQYTQGLLDDSIWNAKLKAFESWYNTCDLRPLYLSRSKFMPAGFVSLIESFPDRCTR